ncbi:hypothetical protein GCM10023149_42110 [Mucilaginibacter gynuensis]|uniref:Secreted protein (Por secretion system target) n=1 Tax=Mucilaginibacter gynuensis TaxID=1302236 RepID=A0ABP8H5X7_9SPHI
MKKLILKPCFESVFALSIISIMCLPPLVLAQNKKETVVKKNIDISITDGDTVINGKNLKDLKGSDRENALRDLQETSRNIAFDIIKDNSGRGQVFVQRSTTNDKNGNRRIIIRSGGDTDNELAMVTDRVIYKDSLGKVIELRSGKPGDKKENFAFNYKMNNGSDNQVFLRRAFDGFDVRNTQNFNYTSTDNDGISTHISYRVSDASKEKVTKIAGVDKAELGLKDLNLSPEFSTGKTTLTFNLPTKTNAEVQFKDSEGKLLWSDKANAGAFSKTFTLALNGIYYLQIKQGAATAVKRIVKED